MSREHAISYINRAVQILNQEDFPPRDKALILASLAQAEATLEVADLFSAGLKLDAGSQDALEDFALTAGVLSRRLGEQ